MQLCIGTAQFGMDYGIRGQKKPSRNDCIEIIDYAVHNAIARIDTANAYGIAEEVVGDFVAQKTSPRESFELFSKLKPNIFDEVKENEYYNIMKSNLEQSLNRLHTDYLDGYLMHSARYVFEDAVISALNRLKKEGYVKRVGVSIYEVSEAKKGITRGDIEFIQLPFSIFDQRMLTGGVFDLAKSENFEVHSRSAFIQGLILMCESEVPPFLEKAKPVIRQIDAFCKKSGLSRVEVAINYVKKQDGISQLVLGVDSLEQLKQDKHYFDSDISFDLIEETSRQFSNLDVDIVMPSLWSKK